ncbi:MAG: DUF1854 domain-containing protein [Gemmatimonadota bacterium]|nr:DUF1854 domain-containing protein [Gemmatimonadota bacterium]
MNSEYKDGWKPTPIDVTHPQDVDTGRIRLFREPAWRLRMTIEGDRSYLMVKIVRAVPLSEPERYICFLDANDEVICMVDDVRELPAAYRAIVREELARRYMTSQIQRVRSIRSEYGVSYWEVATDRGPREFVVKNVGEDARWLDEKRVLILDVDGNRFEVADLGALDKKSRGLVETVL